MNEEVEQKRKQDNYDRWLLSLQRDRENARTARKIRNEIRYNRMMARQRPDWCCSYQ